MFYVVFFKILFPIINRYWNGFVRLSALAQLLHAVNLAYLGDVGKAGSTWLSVSASTIIYLSDLQDGSIQMEHVGLYALLVRYLPPKNFIWRVIKHFQGELLLSLEDIGDYKEPPMDILEGWGFE